MTALAVAQPRDQAAIRALLLLSGRRPLHFVAGGTDLLIAGRPRPQTGVLVDLSRAAVLSGIAAEGDDIRIGAATTVARLAADPLLNARLPALAQAAAQCGAVQIRNRATIGGNIAQAAPAADLLPPLWAAEARLELWDRGGTRIVDIADFVPGDGVLIAAILLPVRRTAPRSGFVKLGPRRELTIARLNLAALLWPERAAPADPPAAALPLADLRLFAGALGPRPIRLGLAEAALRGRPLSPEVLRDFADALRREVDTAIAGRPSQPWKRRAIVGLGLDLIAALCGRSPRDPLFAGIA